MSVLDFARIIVYRFHEKGLEVFLINNDMTQDAEVWKLPKGNLPEQKLALKDGSQEFIDFEETDENGNQIRTVAIEGDWHDIPSIKGMLKYDIKLAKRIINEKLPGAEKGTFFAVKEAFKKVLPDEYKVLKELKDILIDRNSVKNI
ncbi:MAG TPA: hypothetical protein PK147_12675 [Saprospiraceae bacterium]|nr:hypothetical protein [Saprospiraceae bacterium]MCB9327857.1 hypothetical protein [Lewinellaceae bacterium]HPK08770.1 hypothetical protein [Saprospiraceae bacterium]HPQ22706.1 hypothetical protein [Saprospiraceae bacterium]